MRVVLTLVVGAIAWIAAGALAEPAASAAQSEMSLTGNVPGLLYPGAKAEPVSVTLENPSGATLYFTRVAVTVQSTDASGCRPDWFRTSAAGIPAEGIAVPARSSITLPARGVRAPTIRMLDSGSDQDACQDARVALTYSARAQAGAGGRPAPNPGKAPGGTSGGRSGWLPFTGFDPRLLVALGVLLLGADAVLRRAARERQR